MPKKQTKNAITERLLKIVNEKADGNTSQFARQMGIPVSTFQHYMEGYLPRLFETLLNISRTYQVNLHWLLTGVGEPYATYPDMDPVLELKPDELERFFYTRMQNINQIIELRIRGKNEELYADFLVELSDKNFLFINATLDLQDAEQLQIANRLNFIHKFLGRQYWITNVSDKELVELLATSNQKYYRDYFQKIKKRNDLIDGHLFSKDCFGPLTQKEISHQDLQTLICNFWFLITTGKVQDIEFLKGFVANLVDKTRLERIVMADQSSSKIETNDED